MDKLTRFALIISAALAGVGVFYHYVIFLPNVEQQRATEAARRDASARSAEEQKQRDAAVRESAKRLEYTKCLIEARTTYEKDWGNACELIAKLRNEPFNDRSCALPTRQAEAVETAYKQARDACIEEARLGI